MSDGLPEEPQTSETLTYLTLAEKVLKEAGKPLTAKEIWRRAYEAGYHKLLSQFASRGVPATPINSLQAQLGGNIKNDSNTAFYQVPNVSPLQYWLTSSDAPETILEINKKAEEESLAVEIESDSTDVSADDDAIGYTEKDIHPFLVWYAETYMKIKCKTIDHTKSKKNITTSEWKHPDIVGCYSPFSKYKTGKVKQFGRVNSADIMLLCSFELKTYITKNDIAQYFFQAVSNSSWANEGYLVAAEIDEDVRDELIVLSRSFGIGIMLIDMKSPGDSEIISPARRKSEIDWDRLDEISAINVDVERFVEACHEIMTVDERLLNAQWYREHFDEVKPSSEALVKGWEDAHNERIKNGKVVVGRKSKRTKKGAKDDPDQR